MKNILYISSLILLFISCEQSNKPIELLSPKAYHSKITTDSQILDVRTYKEYEAGHLANAIQIDFKSDDFIKDVSVTFDKTKPLFLLSGDQQSITSAEELKKDGFSKIYTLEGGFEKWKTAGYKTIDPLNEKAIKKYILRGKAIGQATVKQLGGNLMTQMKAGGPAQAIPFCNTAAIPITNRFAKKENVTIKRTSHKLRNDKNKATNTEAQILKNYLTSIDNGEKLKPIIKKDHKGNIHFYAPIILEAKCLACHGTIGKEISTKTNDLLKTLYPNDKATGFKVGDLRGIVNINLNEYKN